MLSKIILAVCVSVGSVAGQECFPKVTCTQLLDQHNEDLREQITDTLQREVENNLVAAPTAVAVVQSMFQDGLLPIDMSVERNEVAVLETFWYQLKNFEGLDWIYYGDMAGRFIGFRRAYPCEYTQGANCAYGTDATPVSPAPLLTNNTLVRLRTGAGNTLSAYSTDPSGASGGDTVDLLYTEVNYQTSQRPWYIQGLTDGGDGWTEPYLFSGGKIGISYVKRITDPAQLSTTGVLATDYELEFLNEFINKIDVSGTSTLFIVSATGHLLANNRNASITAIDSTTGKEEIKFATESESDIIRETTKVLFAGNPVLNQPTGDWTFVSQNTIQGNTTINGNLFFYDSIAVVDGKLKWSVVITSQESDFYFISESTPDCMPWLTCRTALREAAAEKRNRKMLMLIGETRDYLGSAVAAVNTIDQVYNNGQLAAAWCTTCGMISLENPTERRNLFNHLKHMMEIYSELIWLYIGFSSGQFAGYKRVDGQLKLWTCYPPNAFDAASCAQVALYSSDTEPLVESSVSDINEKPLTKTWYTMPDQYNLGQYELLWTDPYAFGTGEVGISAVKKGFGGDWTTTGSLGVWGADFSLDFLSTFIAEFEVDEGVILYILNEKKEVLAYSVNGVAQKSNSTTLVAASEHSNLLVRESAASLRKTTDVVYPQLFFDEEGNLYYADSIELTDKDAQLARTYAWDFVMITPENSLYNFDEGDPSDDDDSSPAIIIIIVIGGILVLAGIMFAIWKFACSEPESEKQERTDFFSHPMTDTNGPPVEMGESRDAYQRHLSL